MINYYGNDIEWVPSLENSNKPIYLQIADSIERDVLTGKLKYGSKLPPQRIIANYLKINHSTVTRAYNLCEEKGLIKGTTGRGTYVCGISGVPQDLLSQNGLKVIEMGAVLPLYEVNELSEKIIKSLIPRVDFKTALQYSSPEGDITHRAIAAQWLKNYKIFTNPENVILTCGSQNAIAIILMATFTRGDRIAVDPFVYPELKNLLGYLGIILIPVKGDEKGMLANELELVCQREKVKGVYIISDCQNPTGITMPDDRRVEISRIINAYDLLLIEDGTFNFIKNGNTPISAIANQNNSFYIHGTTKAIVPSLRISYLCSPSKYVHSITKVLHNLLWLTSPFSAEIMSLLISTSQYDTILKCKMEKIAERTKIFHTIMTDYPIFNYDNCMFKYLKLPQDYDDAIIERMCLCKGVQVFSSKRFAVSSEMKESALRIAISAPTDVDEMTRGLNIIKEVISEYPV